MRILKWLAILSAAAFAGALAAQAQTNGGAAQANNGAARPRVALALAGGGAAGLAHVGVIEQLEKLGVRPDCVTGTSMGAVVGGLYAAGYAPADLRRIVSAVDWPRIFTDAERRDRNLIDRVNRNDRRALTGETRIGVSASGVQAAASVFDGQRLLNLLRELTGAAGFARNFDDLPLPFRAVAADLQTGEAVALSGGDLTLAMRASLSIPGLLPPVELQGRMLVDGGVADNLPIVLARELCGDVVIAVNLPAAPRAREDLQSLDAIIVQALSLMITRNVKEQLESLSSDDILIEPQTADIGVLGFGQVARAIEIGAAAIDEETAARLRALAARRGGRASDAPPEELAARSPERRAIFVHEARYENGTRLSDAVLAAYLPYAYPTEIKVADLRRRLARLYALGHFASVSFRFELEGERTIMIVSAPASSQGRVRLKLGLEFSDSFDGRASHTAGAGLTFTELSPRGGRAEVSGALGQRRSLRLAYFEPLTFDQRWTAEVYADYTHELISQYGPNGLRAAEFHRDRGLAGARLHRLLSDDLRFSVGATVEYARLSLASGAPTRAIDSADATTRFELEFLYDTLDEAALPRAGVSLGGGVAQNIERLSEPSGRLSLSGVAATSRGPHTASLFGEIHGAINTDDASDSANAIGGFQRLSGFEENGLGGAVAGALGARYYYRNPLGDFRGLSTFVGASAEVGGAFPGWGDLAGDGLTFGGSAFVGVKTPFGPLYLGVGFAEGGRRVGYLGLRPNF